MKKSKRLLSLLCCASIALSVPASAAGCGGQNVGGADVLQVYCMDAGYGYAWCEDLLDLFQKQDWVKEKYPNLKVEFTQNAVQTYAQTRLDSPANNQFDILFSTGLSSNVGPESNALDITDSVYNSTVPGENVKFIDKMYPSFVTSNKYTSKSDVNDVHFYYSSWASGMDSFVYNQAILDKYGLECPRTTDELEAAAKAIKAEPSKSGNDNGYSFYAGVKGYWSYLFDAWWAQYDGIENYCYFWEGKYNNDGVIERSSKIFDLEGRLEALKVYKQLLDYDKGYLNLNVDDKQFMANQATMLSGQYAFMPNGDWFDSEMATMKGQMEDRGMAVSNLRIMPTPIVSSIIETPECASIADDKELSALIKAIDASDASYDAPLKGEGYEVTQEAWDKVKEARTIVQSIGPGHSALIPKYSDAKEVAIDFLRFMATDIACEQYIKSTGGANLPFYYNVKEKAPETYNSLTTFHKERMDYYNSKAYEVYTLPNTYNYPLVVYSGLTAIQGDYSYYAIFSSANNKKTPEEMFEATKSLWQTGSKFKLALEGAGL